MENHHPYLQNLSGYKRKEPDEGESDYKIETDADQNDDDSDTDMSDYATDETSSEDDCGLAELVGNDDTNG